MRRNLNGHIATLFMGFAAVGGIAHGGDDCGPAVVGEVQREPGSTSWDVAIDGTIACIANFDGLYIVDVTDPANPATLGFAPIAGIPGSVGAGGGYAAVGDELFGLRVFDISDPANPVQTAEVDLTFGDFAGVSGVEIFSGRVYVSAYELGFFCYEIEKDGSLSLFSAYNGHVGSGKISVRGSNVFVPGSSPDLTILRSNLSDIGGAILRGSFDLGPLSGSLDAAAWADTCYLAMASGSIEILDISDDSSPQSIGAIPLPGQPVDVETWGNILYVSVLGFSSGAPDRVIMFDVTDPSNPVELDEIGVGNAYGIAFSGTTLFAAADNRGLVSIDTSNLCTQCPVDFQPDNFYNFFDISVFIDLYNAGDLAADLAAPFGVLNFFDIAEMIDLYQLGCP